MRWGSERQRADAQGRSAPEPDATGWRRRKEALSGREGRGASFAAVVLCDSVRGAVAEADVGEWRWSRRSEVALRAGSVVIRGRLGLAGGDRAIF